MTNKPFSKSEKDWSKATRLIIRSEDDPENLKTWGSYHSDTRDIHLDPEVLKIKDSDTIGHELAHRELRHGDFEAIEGEDYPLDYLESGFRQIPPTALKDQEIQNVLSSLVDPLEEFEVRIYQKARGFYISEYDDFISYLKYTLMNTPELGRRQLLLQTANWAISNMQKKDFITSKQAKRYRQQVNSVAKSFRVRSRI